MGNGLKDLSVASDPLEALVAQKEKFSWRAKGVHSFILIDHLSEGL